MYTQVNRRSTLRWIEGWAWDEEDLPGGGNIGHLARHGVSPATVLEVATMGPKFRENAPGRSASFQMIGPDAEMKIWTICILESPGNPGIWKAITGWESTQAEADWYWGGGGK